jgi:ribonuclease HI
LSAAGTPAVAKPILVELLRFIAANEELPRTLQRYPGHTRDTIGKLVAAAADRLEEAEKDREGGIAPAGSKGIKVRKISDAERASQRAAAELDESMSLSRAEQERRRRERAAEADRERAEAQAVAAARPPRVRLYTDGAARGNPGPAGAGAVIISPEGHIVAKLGKFLGESTNNVAEYTGLILGLRRAKAMGIKVLEVLSDSELLVKQLAGDYAVKAEHLKPLHDEAQALLRGFSDVEVRHIPREENTQADLMSNRAIDERL